MQFGVEVETDLKKRKSTATFGCAYEIPEVNATLKGSCPLLTWECSNPCLAYSASVDSNGAVGAVMEKRLLSLPFTICFSGQALHANQPQYKFGVGLMVR